MIMPVSSAVFPVQLDENLHRLICEQKMTDTLVQFSYCVLVDCNEKNKLEFGFDSDIVQGMTKEKLGYQGRHKILTTL